jgi:putative ABC transport system permease protein
MSIISDVRHALRTFLRNPGYAIAVVLTLALGIGVNTTMFSVVDAVLLRPVPLNAPDRVVKVGPRGFLYSTFRAVREESADAFSAMSAYAGGGAAVSTLNGTQVASVTFVDEDYFDVLGVRPAIGRLFDDREHVPGAAPVAVVTEAFWRLHLQADSAALGRTVRAGDGEATIVGVLPRGFRGLDLDISVDVFMPITSAAVITPQSNYLSDTVVRGSSPSVLNVVARLRDGVDIATAEAAVRQIHARHAPNDQTSAISLEPMTTAALPVNSRQEASRFISLLAAVAGLVFLVGCASLAGLMLARNEHRTRETAVRAALGASRWRLVQGFASEIALLGAFGVGVSMLVSVWLLNILSGFVLPGRVNVETLEIALSLRAVLFALVVAAIAALLSGLMPAIRIARIDVISRLRSQQAGMADRTLIRRVLVSAQVAMAVMLVIGAGLFVRSLHNALSTDVGFRADRLAFATISLRGAQYDEDEAARFYETLVPRLNSMPGVERATFGGLPLVQFSMSTPVVKMGAETRKLPQNINAYFCGPDYFRTLGVQVLSGRDFDSRDTAQSEPVIVVSAALARTLWPGQDAIGKELTFVPMKHNARVVGVVADVKYSNLRESDRHAMYVPWQQNRSAGLRSAGLATIVVRTASRPALILPLLRQEISRFDRSLPVATVSTVEETVGRLVMTQRLGASLLSWFSILALTVAVIGVYGLVSYAVTSRAQEIGVRMALGADPAIVVRQMILASAAPTVVGVLIGLAGGFALSVFARPFLFNVEPHDPMTFVVITSLVLGSTLLASYVPARRAARIDPLTALRTE